MEHFKFSLTVRFSSLMFISYQELLAPLAGQTRPSKAMFCFVLFNCIKYVKKRAKPNLEIIRMEKNNGYFGHFYLHKKFQAKVNKFLPQKKQLPNFHWPPVGQQNISGSILLDKQTNKPNHNHNRSWISGSLMAIWNLTKSQPNNQPTK